MNMDRSALLQLLRQGGYVTGEDIGRSLGVTRAAVSKAVAGLRQEGFVIDSVPNRGYRLTAAPDRLDRDVILAALGDHPWAAHLELLPVIDSTNNYLKTLASRGAPQGTAVLAEAQTEGRGRLGRSFDSASHAGIYLSVLLRPACPPAALMTLTAQAAVAVRRAIGEVCGVLPGIKWVNDLVLGGKKICGILTELSFEAESGLVSYAVVGIGVNCNRAAEDFPPALQQMAGSIYSVTGRQVDRSLLCAAMLRELSGLPALDWSAEYRAACVNLGKTVRLLTSGTETGALGIAEDVGQNAELLVRMSDGSLRAVNSGEVSVRGMYGYTE